MDTEPRLFTSNFLDGLPESFHINTTGTVTVMPYGLKTAWGQASWSNSLAMRYAKAPVWKMGSLYSDLLLVVEEDAAGVADT